MKDIVQLVKRSPLKPLIGKIRTDIADTIVMQLKPEQSLSIRQHFRPFIRQVAAHSPRSLDFVINRPNNLDEPPTLALTFTDVASSSPPARDQTYQVEAAVHKALSTSGLSDTEFNQAIALIKLCGNIDALSCTLDPIKVSLNVNTIKITCGNMASSVPATWCKQLDDVITSLDDVVIDLQKRTWEFTMSRRRTRAKHSLLFS